MRAARQCCYSAVLRGMLVYACMPAFGPQAGSRAACRASWRSGGAAPTRRHCASAAPIYYLLTIVVGLTLWLCDQHFCVHLHSLLACHSPQSPRFLHGGADGPPEQPSTKACGSPEGRGPPQASSCGREGCWWSGPTWTPAIVAHAGLPGGLHNPQFHAWWHGIMGVHSYLGPTFMVYQRLVYLGREPRLCYLLGVLPYVEVPGPRGRHRREAPEDALASGLPPQLPLQAVLYPTHVLHEHCGGGIRGCHGPRAPILRLRC